MFHRLRGSRSSRRVTSTFMLGFAAYVLEVFDIRSNVGPVCKTSEDSRMHSSKFALHQSCAFDNPYLFIHGVQNQFVGNNPLSVTMLLIILCLYIYIYIWKKIYIYIYMSIYFIFPFYIYVYKTIWLKKIYMVTNDFNKNLDKGK